MMASPFTTDISDLQVIEHLVAGASVLAAQLPAASQWSPERRLAGAVLAAALIEVRDHHAQPTYRRAVEQDLEWIFSDEAQWPFAFLPLCHTLGVDPDFVRATVRRWVNRSNPRETRVDAYRNDIKLLHRRPARVAVQRPCAFPAARRGAVRELAQQIL
jgi:hypothetical protein